MLEEFTGYLKVKGLRSHKDFVSIVEGFLLYLDNMEIHYLSLKLKDILEYRRYLIEKNLCYSTINNKINKSRSFYSFLEKRDYILRSPFRDLKPLRSSKSLPKNILSIDDMGKLLDYIPIRNSNDFKFKAVVELLYGSALRISEVDVLKTNDIDYIDGVLTITEIKKGGKRRRTPATEASLKAVNEYLTVSNRRDKEYVFPRGERTTLRGFVNRRLNELCSSLQLNRLTTHSFRHSAATSMLRSGAGIREVQAFLGHESILSTEKYTRVVKEDLKKVIHDFHPREVL